VSKKQEIDLNKLEGLKAKIKELEEEIKKLKEGRVNQAKYDVRIVTSEEEIIELAKLGYDCQQIGEGKWLMRIIL